MHSIHAYAVLWAVVPRDLDWHGSRIGHFIMRCAVLVLVLLATPVAAAADSGGDRVVVAHPYTSLRTPRLDVSLLAVEATGFAAVTVMFFTFAGTDSDLFAPVWAGAGVATLVMSAWSTGLLVRSTRELRWRRSGTVNAKRSSQLNRWMIAYDFVMASAYVGFSIPIAVNGAKENLPAVVASASIGGALMAGLHLWSLAAHARERKRYKRRRIAFIGTGFAW